MKPKNGGLEDDIPSRLGAMLIVRGALAKTNMAMTHGPFEVIFLLKMVIFQPALLVYQRVHYVVQRTLKRNTIFQLSFHTSGETVAAE